MVLPDPLTQTDSTLYDILCVGFGPSGVSIAVTLSDATRQPIPSPALNVCFIERNPTFTWHGDMLIDDTRMQISFIKDLATLRDPTSRFTFLNYLHEENRLLHFLNLGTFYPLRKEYNEYMAWVAGHFGHLCFFGEEVLRVEPVYSLDQGFDRVRVICKRLSDGLTTIRYTRNIILAIGALPPLKSNLEWSQPLPGMIHASKYLSTLPSLLPTPTAPYRIAVIGGGQSAAEIFTDLISKYPSSQVSLIMRDEALRPADDSPFVNQVVFDPDRTDAFYRKSLETRRAMLQKNKSTNYAVVNLDLIERIYSMLYKQKLPGGVEQHRIFTESDVINANVDSTDSIVLHLRKIHPGQSPLDTTNTTPLSFDAVILCTGYQRTHHTRMLQPLLPFLETETPVSCAGDHQDPISLAACVCDKPNQDPTLVVDRDYRVRTDKTCNVGVYLQGCCEESHGLSDTLLSVLAVRGVEVITSLIEKDPHLSSSGSLSHPQTPVHPPHPTPHPHSKPPPPSPPIPFIHPLPILLPNAPDIPMDLDLLQRPRPHLWLPLHRNPALPIPNPTHPSRRHPPLSSSTPDQ
ncbi:L-lysine 6-monooxygenase (NADPH-requiring)-domain-containing protein [Chytridium lagenaria]|nr:L-lysine 6-monooxygenase (NADPH-requiring)-domain-containing protein [Chytridium lagenaria]